MAWSLLRRARPSAAAAVALLTVQQARADDVTADAYYRALLRHTRWVEGQVDTTAGTYQRRDFAFAVVLGNAVLLERGTYDPVAAGVSREELRARTIATVRRYAASNVLAGGTEWGKTLFFDTTFQAYFILAARLLWNDLDADTRAAVEKIARGQADYTTSLGPGDDPRSDPFWTPRGRRGAFAGNTRLDEMGVYAQSLAPGLAIEPTHPGWREAFGQWSRNMSGLPAADLANAALLDGVPVMRNTAANLHDGFVVENHDALAPHYQEELWRVSARNAAQFLAVGQQPPQVVLTPPNGERMWRATLAILSDAGEPLMPTVADREHLYGRDVLPLAFRAQILGDSLAARAEANLAARLAAYQDYPPAGRLTKLNGEPKYEPEARAELALAYLFHEWRPRPVPLATEDELFARAATAVDFGAAVGLVAHQSPRAWAGVVSKPGFVKMAWQPRHDDWLFTVSGSAPMLLPPAARVDGRWVRVYRRVADGFDGTVSMLTIAAGRAGFATLPTGTVVYASAGLAGEGHVRVHNRTMPGIAGLDGERTYRLAEGAVAVPSADRGGDARPARRYTGSSRERWVDVDGRAGFVVRTSPGTITVRDDELDLAAGMRAPLLVEGYVGAARDLATLARATPPRTGAADVLASDADGHLAVFNLASAARAVTVDLHQDVTALRVYAGRQRVTDHGTGVDVPLAAGTAVLEPPRFVVRAAAGGAVPPGLEIIVQDAQHLELHGAVGAPPATVVITQRGGATVRAVAQGSSSTPIVMPGGRPYPLADRALGRVTFPTSPLPAGMSDPAAAVDDDPRSAWTPGINGRMVVDLGAHVSVQRPTLRWSSGAPPTHRITISTDGRTYRDVTRWPTTTRYVAVSTAWRHGQATLTTLEVPY